MTVTSEDSFVMGTFSIDDKNDPLILEKSLNVLIGTTKETLTQILQFAALRCRRDHLWNMVLKDVAIPAQTERKALAEEGNKDDRMSIVQLKELLSHVYIEKLDVANQCLKELSESSNVGPIPNGAADSSIKIPEEWQNRLICVLQEKYLCRHRLFSSEDGQFKVSNRKSFKGVSAE